MYVGCIHAHQHHDADSVKACFLPEFPMTVKVYPSNSMFQQLVLLLLLEAQMLVLGSVDLAHCHLSNLNSGQSLFFSNTAVLLLLQTSAAMSMLAHSTLPVSFRSCQNPPTSQAVTLSATAPKFPMAHASTTHAQATHGSMV